ncbi:hypothetical protein [Helicobacter cappadocius]|uniref:Uncharacterized protein n=1 Tax=Helicobacter cappadocius TaxID=3063998 RepID=A0AA90PTY1_9HELI|nr:MULTISPECIES: hypothetical protein [unclassified Helicobacter]MDO7253561.1 hypothetical protein [Helicobacter sp. faydin-H75]MDP2539489.1 hypothetical protein [Helicobacter sp. faydin-H76]
MKTNEDKIDFEDLALEVIDMLGVALHFAGVKTECIEQAIDAYLEELDNLDEDTSYGQKEIIEVIKSLKIKRKELFKA